MSSSPELSVVVPVHGCAACLEALQRRLLASLEPLTDRFEVLYVDDRSPDGAWRVLTELTARDPRVRALRLSRNFGQHAAITAGLARARGRFVVVMDCDLEEPPEVIPKLYAKAKDGYDIVHGVRRGRRHGPARRWASRLYRYLLLEADRHAEYGTLSLVSRKVVEAFLRIEDRDREYMLMLDWLGFSHASVEFEHAERHDGRSSYTARRLLRVAMDGMFFRTTVLLRLIVLLGFAIAGCGAALAAYNVLEYAAGHSPRGYTSLVVLMLLLSGFIIISLGVVGLYVGRIFDQVKRRPLFIVDEQLNADGTPADGLPSAARGIR